MQPIRQAWLGFAALALLVSGFAAPGARAQGAADSYYFPQTHHTVGGVFWTYWQSHGGLGQQGYPITEEFQETSPVDHKPYTVQYFERAVFELHPENRPPNNVLLSPLGSLALKARYPTAAPPSQKVNGTATQSFPQTGHAIGGGFGAYWQSHGGLAQFGYPLSDEFQETSPVNGKPYTVQYFERAVMEYHPEAPPNYMILLSLLGRLQYHARYETVPHPRDTDWPPAPGLAPTAQSVLFNATFATADLAAWHTPGAADQAASWIMENAHLQQAGDAVGEASPDETLYVAGDRAWSNISLEAQYFITSGDPVGVAWRVAGDRYYRVQILPALPNAHPKAALQLVQGGRVTTLASTPPERFAGYTYGQWQTIEVLAQGAHQQVSVDGVVLLDVQDGTLAQGQIGLYAVEDQATAFDNVRVQQLGP